ncbi:hypothetical protein AYO20_02172 [Fonsecaea nubica]|uniref:Uncharacterized protein n=1 Tax=Fonsecaea nubica TaxID=856822 RepID=A0A178DBA5_9EURO|nr:hypothetical protein AYO20_02172 [Fonsecaea nubica]OAL38523.1 hypothetical protein AYO20_02172 [Fonsecaea nubica]
MPPSSDGNTSMPMEDLGRRAKGHNVKKRLEMTIGESTEAKALLEETYCSNDLKFLSSADQRTNIRSRDSDNRPLQRVSLPPSLASTNQQMTHQLSQSLQQGQPRGSGNARRRIASIGHLSIVAEWTPNPSDAHARTESTAAELFDRDDSEMLLSSVGQFSIDIEECTVR